MSLSHVSAQSWHWRNASLPRSKRVKEMLHKDFMLLLILIGHPYLSGMKMWLVWLQERIPTRYVFKRNSTVYSKYNNHSKLNNNWGTYMTFSWDKNLHFHNGIRYSYELQKWWGKWLQPWFRFANHLVLIMCFISMKWASQNTLPFKTNLPSYNSSGHQEVHDCKLEIPWWRWVSREISGQNQSRFSVSKANQLHVGILAVFLQYMSVFRGIFYRFFTNDW